MSNLVETLLTAHLKRGGFLKESRSALGAELKHER